MRLNRSYSFFSPLLTVVLCLLLSQTQFFPWLSDTTLDIFFKIRGPLPPSQSIVIIGIDDYSLKKIGPWPFPRKIHAQLLGKLKQARSIGFDLLFTHPGESDTAFIQVIGESPPVTFAVAGNYQGEPLLPPESFIPYVNLGHIEILLADDGVVRRVESRKWGLDVMPQKMLFSSSKSFNAAAVENHIRTINFYGPEFTFLYVPYADVLSGAITPGFFRDRLVLVGSEAIALGDVHVTPLSLKHPVPGVEVQATILNNFLDDSFIDEKSLGSYAFSLFFLAFGVWFWPKWPESRNMLLGLGAVVVLGMVSLTLFRFNYYINPSLPIFILSLSYLAHLIGQWLWLTAKLVKQIRQLDKQLEDGLEKVFTTIPTGLVTSPERQEQGKLRGGIDRHISRIHNGIEALALQNSFINHLLSKETPPLVLWQKEKGEVVLANAGFVELWQNLSGGGFPLPTLIEFRDLLVSKVVSSKKLFPEDDFEADLQMDKMVDIRLLVDGKQMYNRVLIHEVKASILGFSGVMASFTDVTEIRELERIKGEVMNIVSHELKLPLTTILGYGEMLTEMLSGEKKQFAHEICSQSNRLAKMIENFLDIARIESGKYTIHRYPFDLLTMVYDAASGVQHSAENKKIEIKYSMPVKISHLMGDEVLITQAILNLLDNAVKFSPPRTSIQVTVLENESDITLKVIDEGPGVAGEEKKKIFDKFMRGGQQKGSGFGLGLSFVKQVVESHGGTIGVEDGNCGGAKFIMVLPKSIIGLCSVGTL